MCAHIRSQTMGIHKLLGSRGQPSNCRLTFSRRDDGVGLGHGSIVGGEQEAGENSAGNGTLRRTITTDTLFPTNSRGGTKVAAIIRARSSSAPRRGFLLSQEIEKKKKQ